MTLEKVIALADSTAPASPAAVSFHLERTDRPDQALEALFDLLGDDPSISKVDLVIEGRRVGTLTSEALSELVEDRTMKIGDGVQAGLIGDPAPCFIRLHCPEANCVRRAIASPDLYAPPVICSLHHCAMVADEDR
jgi:hypothetical protein